MSRALRDTRKSLEYFEHELSSLEDAWKHMESLLAPTDDETKQERGRVRLAGFALNRLHLAFSAGADATEMASHTESYLQAVAEMFATRGTPKTGYHFRLYLAEFLALYGNESSRRRASDLFDQFEVDEPLVLATLRLEPLESTESIASTPRQYRPQAELLLASSTEPDRLFEWIDASWYKSNRHEHWHNTHKKDYDYRGYWCFAGAAVAKIHGFDTTGWERSPYWPDVSNDS